ncbi:PREDICTED: patched domain-containing protein 3, partial [Buceros rhinoceros silvestris]|uniref:patched domain-containing protein 3 n=1 Tax=Buceros rhinoceros silvestris TaxID=175836 RepID=UPI0005282DBB
VTYFTSLSRQQEFEGNTKSVIPLFSITYFLTITFSVVSCLRLSCVRNNVWLACCGVVSAGLAVLTSFGLMLFCGVPFVVTVANAPFLILGVGVDDMFIMIASWEKSLRKKEKYDVKSLLSETYAEAALSVTITTLTDVLAFFIGTWTPFPSVRSFCLYTGTAFVFCYIYTMTFFGAVIVLNHKREQGNRHWLTCMPVGVDKDQADESCLYNACCIGNCSRQSYQLETTQPESEHPMSIFFEKYYGPFFTNKWIKLLVVLLYGAYLGGSIYGCSQMREGIDLRNLASDDSYVIPYYDDNSKYFSEYGPRIMVVITESVDYWNETVRLGIENCTQNLEGISYVDKNLSESWLSIYTVLANKASVNINNKTDFLNILPVLFRFVPSFQWDINKTQDKIEASRFFIQTVNVTSAVDEKHLLSQLREAAKQCSVPLLVYHPAFIYYDQYLVIVQNTIQNVLVAAGAMLVVSLLLIPSLLCCLWVTFAIASVIVGVAGFMTFWNVSLDSISMINLVICIGFSVDFSAHISYAFVTSGESSANERAIKALSQLGYPVLQGAVSTILGVVVLAAAKTYIFRTFFKIMFLVILFGALHGLVFIPVFLTYFGNFGRPLHSTKPSNVSTHNTKSSEDQDAAWPVAGGAGVEAPRVSQSREQKTLIRSAVPVARRRLCSGAAKCPRPRSCRQQPLSPPRPRQSPSAPRRAAPTATPTAWRGRCSTSNPCGLQWDNLPQHGLHRRLRELCSVTCGTYCPSLVTQFLLTYSHTSLQLHICRLPQPLMSSALASSRPISQPAGPGSIGHRVNF